MFCVALVFVLMLVACNDAHIDVHWDDAAPTINMQDPIVSAPPDDENPIVGVNPATPTGVAKVFSQLLEDERLSSAEHWVQAAVLLGASGTEPDIGMIAAYYGAVDDFAMLRLFATRFCKTLNSDDELAISEHTALSLAAYLIEYENVDALFEHVSDLVKTGWLHSIGVYREYIDPYEGYLDSMVITGLNPLVARTDKSSFNLNTFSFRAAILGFDTAARMENFLFRELHAQEYILNWLQENAGDSFSFVHIPDFVRYHANSTYTRSSADPDRQVIYLNSAFGHLHEYVHIIFQDGSSSKGIGGTWRQEGLAQYLADVIYPHNYETMAFKEYGIDRFVSGDSLEKYGVFIYEKYSLYTGNELSYPPDIRALYDALSYALMLSDDDDEDLIRRHFIFWPINKYPHASYRFEDDTLGNMLSYIEAASFIAFLADTYTFEKTLRLTNTRVCIEDIFGKSYVELHSEWIDWLKR